MTLESLGLLVLQGWFKMGLGTFFLSLGNFKQISIVAKICCSYYSWVINYPQNLRHSRDMMSGASARNTQRLVTGIIRRHLHLQMYLILAVSWDLSGIVCQDHLTHVLSMWLFGFLTACDWAPRASVSRDKNSGSCHFLKARNWHSIISIIFYGPSNHRAQVQRNGTSSPTC